MGNPWEDPDVVGRFWPKVERPGDGECWPWLACRDCDGYGRFQVRGVALGAHVFAHMVTHRRRPERGMVVRHTCDHPWCVNPAHLRLGTPADNVRDRDGRGRTRNQNADKTHCPHGHEYTTENTHRSADGRRYCRTCNTRPGRRHRTRRQRGRVQPATPSSSLDST